MYAAAPTAVLVWSMGITQHETGTDNVAAIVNLALARGNVGRPGAGLMPIRGHSGVQGGAEMGAYATGVARRRSRRRPRAPPRCRSEYGFPVPAQAGAHGRGDDRGGATRRARRALLERRQLPRGAARPPSGSMRALERVPLRVHQDIVLSSQMLVDGETVVLLPAATRYEQRDGGTETTTERRIAFSPEIAAARSVRRAASGRSSSTSPRRVDPDRAHLVAFESGQADPRRDRDASCPSYAGIETLRRTGDAVQWGGARLCEDGGFPTPTARPASPPSSLSTTSRARGAVPPEHPTGQAVQHDGVPRRRPAHRRGPRRGVRRRGRRRAARAARRRGGASSGPSTASCAAT